VQFKVEETNEALPLAVPSHAWPVKSEAQSAAGFPSFPKRRGRRNGKRPCCAGKAAGLTSSTFNGGQRVASIHAMKMGAIAHERVAQSGVMLSVCRYGQYQEKRT
jgi:hypothetical protein